MAEVVDVTAVEAETEPAVPAAATSAAPSRAASILDAIRATAAEARTNLWWDMPLPDTVPGNLALRLGVPSEARESTLLVDVAAANLDHDLEDLAVNILGVVDLDDDEDVIEGLDATTLAAAFAEQLYGAPRPVVSDVDAVRELFSMGSPPRVNAQALTSVAALYRRWSANPTSLRSSDPTTSE
jgi:hypothetical protein